MSAAAPPPRPARTGIGRSTAIFAGWTGVSRIAGLAREIIAAALFGTAGAINAFVIAFQVPNLLRSLVADSALSAAFVPVFTELEEEGRHDEARRLAGALVGIITVGLGAITALAVLLAPYVMPLFAPRLSPELLDETVRLARLMFPIVVLLGLTGLVVAILQANGRFGASAFVPVLWNGVIIAMLGVAAAIAPDDITLYAVGVLLGTLAQLLFLLPSLRGMGSFPISLGRGNPHVRRVLVLMLPVTLSLGLINVNLVVNSAFATLVSEEAVRAIDAAFRLYLLPQGIFSVAIATVLFPAISRLVARGDTAGVRDTVSGGVRQIFFMLVPASAFLLVLAEPVTRLVFERGEFDAESTALTSEALVFFAVGLVFNGASLLVIRAFFSLRLPWTPTRVALLGVALNGVLCALFYRPLGVGGIPLASSLASLVTFLVMLVALERRLGGLRRADLLDGVGRTLLAGLATAGLAWASWRVLDDALGRSLLAQALSLGAALAVAATTYLAACRALRLREVAALARLARPLQ